MKKTILLLGVLASMPLYAMDAATEVKEDEQHAEGQDEMGDTAFRIGLAEEVLDGVDVDALFARNVVKDGLQKIEELFGREEELASKVVTREGLISQILDCLLVLSNQLARSEAGEIAASKEERNLENLWGQLKEARSSDGKKTILDVPVSRTLTELKTEQGLRNSNIENLKERIKGIRESLKKEQEEREKDKRKFEDTRANRGKLERKTLGIGKKVKGTAGKAALEALEERVAEQEEPEGQEEEVPQAPQKGLLSRAWDKCVIN